MYVCIYIYIFIYVYVSLTDVMSYMLYAWQYKDSRIEAHAGNRLMWSLCKLISGHTLLGYIWKALCRAQRAAEKGDIWGIYRGNMGVT